MNLENQRVLITRPRHQAMEFAAALQSLGAVPIPFPVIEIVPVKDPTQLDKALKELHGYHWLILTSVNGVEAVWNRFAALSQDRLPAEVRIAAIGPKTAAALEVRGVTPHFIPSEYVAEAILPGLGHLRGCRVLLPRADLARKALPEAIVKAGGIAHEIVAYHTLPVRPDPLALQALQSGVDVVTFTSSSTVRNFIALVRTAGLEARCLPGQPLIACIGPITAATAREEGLPVHIVAAEYTAEGLIRALLSYSPSDSL
jgi:uroporphyrinogen-III synthase